MFHRLGPAYALAVSLIAGGWSGSSVTSAQSPQGLRLAPNDSATLDTLRRRLSPAEAHLLVRLDSLTVASEIERIRKANEHPYRDAVLANLLVIVTVLGGGLAFYRWVSERRATRVGHAIDALRWFEGDTQKRNLGIATIEANYHRRAMAELRPVWQNVLVNQAVYLLTESGQYKRLDELENLRRIMALLARWQNGVRTKLSDDRRKAVRNALQSARNHSAENERAANELAAERAKALAGAGKVDKLKLELIKTRGVGPIDTELTGWAASLYLGPLDGAPPASALASSTPDEVESATVGQDMGKARERNA